MRKTNKTSGIIRDSYKSDVNEFLLIIEISGVLTAIALIMVFIIMNCK